MFHNRFILCRKFLAEREIIFLLPVRRLHRERISYRVRYKSPPPQQRTDAGVLPRFYLGEIPIPVGAFGGVINTGTECAIVHDPHTSL